MSPMRDPPLASRYWFITAVRPAQIGADCDVPPPTTTWPSRTILTPVKGSATAATSGVMRIPVLRSDGTACAATCCHGGSSNSDETPPPVPWESGTSNQVCSDTHSPSASVDNVVPPTLVISGSEAIESRPTSCSLGGDDQSCPPRHSMPARSPLALKAVVPCDCAVRNADRTGARSAAVISLSHPQPIEKLHTAPGNRRSVSSSISPILR